jgi:putative membrane protein
MQALRSSVVHFAQGLLMGGADIVPGVSGGTMALIVGIYTRLIASISAFVTAAVTVVRGDLAGGRRRFGEVEWGLVIPLAVGLLTAIAIGSRVIPPLMEAYPEESRGLFFGLVAASVAIPWLRMERPGAREAAIVLVAAVTAFVITGLPQAETADPPLLRVFASAAVAICAMILPGVSGAFLLHVMGIYTVTLNALREMDVAYVLTFVLGAMVGLGSFAKLLSWLLKHHSNATMAALVGLMAGSLRALWPWQTADRDVLAPGPGDPVAMVVVLGLAGFAAVSLLTWWGARRLHPVEHPRG